MVKVSWCLCLLAAAVAMTAGTGTSAHREATLETAAESDAVGRTPHSHSAHSTHFAHSTSKDKASKDSKSKTTAEDFTRRDKTRRRSHSRVEEALRVPEGHTAEVPAHRLPDTAEGAASLSPAGNQEENFSVVADRTPSSAAEAERAPSPAADGVLLPPAAEVADRARPPRAEREIGRDQAPLRSHLPQSEPERSGGFRSRYASDRNRSRSEGSQGNRFVAKRNQKNRYGSDRNRFRNEENQRNRYGSDRNRYSTAENRKSPSWSDRNRVTPGEGSRRSAPGGGNTDRFPTQASRYSPASRYNPLGDRSHPSTDTRRFTPAARPGEGSNRGRVDSEPAWLAWYNTLPWRQEMLSQYGESQRPSRSSFGL